jgi:hypothetical protein
MDVRLENAVETSRHYVETEVAHKFLSLDFEISEELEAVNAIVPETIVDWLDETPQPFDARKDAILRMRADLLEDEEWWDEYFSHARLKDMFLRRVWTVALFKDFPVELTRMIVDRDSDWVTLHNGPDTSQYDRALDGGLPPIEGGVLLHECEFCGQVFDTHRRLERHLEAEHGV